MNTKKTMGLVIIATAGMAVSGANAATYTWVGGDTGNANAWTNLDNWVVGTATPTVLPGASDDVIIPNVGIFNFPILNTNASVSSLTINSGGILNYSGSRSLSAGGAITVNGTLGASGASSTVSANGKVTVSGQLYLNDVDADFNDDLEISSSGTFDMSNSSDLDVAVDVYLDGDMEIDDSTANFHAEFEIDSSANLDIIDSDVDFQDLDIMSGQMDIDNSGIEEVYVYGSGGVLSTAVLNVVDGRLDFQIDSAAAQTFEVSGLLDVFGDGVVDVTGDVIASTPYVYRVEIKTDAALKIRSSGQFDVSDNGELRFQATEEVTPSYQVDGELRMDYGSDADPKIIIEQNTVFTGSGSLIGDAVEARLDIQDSRVLTSEITVEGAMEIRGLLDGGSVGQFTNAYTVDATTGEIKLDAFVDDGGTNPTFRASSGAKLSFQRNAVLDSYFHLAGGELEIPANFLVWTCGDLRYDSGASIDLAGANNEFRFEDFDANSTAANPGSAQMGDSCSGNMTPHYLVN